MYTCPCLDFLKGIQAMEIFALIAGVASIAVWIVYISKREMVEKNFNSRVLKVTTIVLSILTGLSINMYIDLYILF